MSKVCLHDTDDCFDDKETFKVGLNQNVLLLATAYGVVFCVIIEELLVTKSQQVNLQLLKMESRMVYLKFFL